MTYQLHSHTITFEAALRDVASKSAKVRAQAAHALSSVVDPADRQRAVDALVDLLADPRPEVRVEAARSLGELDSEAAVRPLIDRFDDPEAAVRQSAAISLGKLGFSSAFDDMARILAEGPPDLRFQAATSLAEIDPDRAVDALIEALGDDDGEVVGAAAVSLGAIGATRATDRLARLLDDWSRPETRFDLAYALADLDDDRGIDVLAGFVGHKDVAWEAVEALEKTGSARAVTPLAGVVADRGAQIPIKLRAAAAILALDAALTGAEVGADAADAARDALVAGLSVRKLDQRGLAVELLGKLGGAWAVAGLEKLASKRAGRRLREEIADALAHIAAREA